MQEIYELVVEGPGKNALSSAVMEDVIRKVGEAAGRPVLVRGAGDSFCAGLNLKEVASIDVAGMARFLGLLDDMVDALFSYPGPLVTCLNGHAIAGGCVIALCGDLRVSSSQPKLKIGLNEIALGLEFPPKIMKLVRHRLSRSQVERVVLEAGLYSPSRALELGLVDELADDPVARGRELLLGLARHPKEIYAASKRSLRGGQIDLGEADRAYFATNILARWTAPAVKEQALAALKR